MTITIVPPVIKPTGSTNQFFCSTATVADINTSETSIKWYDSATGGNELASTTSLIDGTNYYASKIVNGCESNNRLAVSINLIDPIITASATTVCKGSPVNLQVNISPTSPIDPRWELLIPPSNYNGTQINLSETAYDRINNYVYSLFKQGSNLITYRFNLNNNSVSNIVTTNIPNNVSTFTYDYSNNRLIAGRTGRDIISAVPANGGDWSQIGNGSFDAESYGSQYYWNSNNQKTGFFGGYGFFYVRNWIWENGSSWTNSFANNNNCGINIPAKRVTQLALGKPNTNKIYFFSGQGSCTGQQTVSSCNLGSPWATDVGVFCWLKDLWELDLNTQTFNNILPVNSSSITKEGNFVYNYTENSFYIVGGYSPSPTYNSNFGNVTNYETSILKYDPTINSGFIPFVVQGTPPPALTLNSIGINKTYYDEANNQIVWIRKDGVWGVKLGSTSSINSILWSTGETTSSINPSPLETTNYWVDVTTNGVTCRKNITITVNPIISPTFTQVASICSGTTLTGLSETSNNSITGSWSPSLNNTVTTNYTFTPTSGQCATTATMTIEVNPTITPIFTQVAAICKGASLSSLPTKSNNSITGTWSPVLNILDTTAYTFTPTPGQCSSVATMTITVNPIPNTPTGVLNQKFCSSDSPTLRSLLLNQSLINWYSTLTSQIVLSLNTPLVDGETYYATQFSMNTDCQSIDRIAVKVDLNDVNTPSLKNQTFCLNDLKTIGDIDSNGENVLWYDSSIGGEPLSNESTLIDNQVLYVSGYDKMSNCESNVRQMFPINLIDCELSSNNLLTLNGNNLNDNLNIKNIEYFSDNHMQIFNRSGQLVWKTDKYNNTTNTFLGRANCSGVFEIDKNLPTGTYFYVLNYYNPFKLKFDVAKSFFYINNNN
jgi:hypothetical protein